MNDLYTLYTRSFPQYPASREKFAGITDGAVLFTRTVGQTPAGFALVRENSISLLCVDEAYRHRGIGSSLLAEAEKHIAETGAETILLGRGNGYILQGVPEEHPEAVSFFQKRGYIADWSSVNMMLDLRTYHAQDHPIPPCPADVIFRPAQQEDTDALLRAVLAVNEKWVWYFEHNSDPVLVAEQNSEIIGFEMLCTKDIYFSFHGETIGSIGCVGVIKSARCQGIGLRMVQEGLLALKKQGCTRMELLYTYKADWYGKLGFAVMHTQWMGKKTI